MAICYIDLSDPQATGEFDIGAIVDAAIRGGDSARQPAKRSASSTPTTLVSYKMGEVFATDCGGEADVLMLADILEEVAAFRPQAVAVRYFDGRRIARAFPDIALRMIDGSIEFWEIKPERHDAETIERLCILASTMRAAGLRYRVRTPRWFRRNPQLTNARLLYRQADRPITDRLAADIEAAIDRQGCRTLGALRGALGIGMYVLHGAAARGLFAIDIATERLNDATSIRKALRGACSGGYENTTKGGH